MKLTCFLLTAIIFSSCNNSDRVVYKNVDSSGFHWIVRKAFDKNGRLSEEELLNADSIRVGYFRKWNDNKLVCAGTYVKGKKDGTWFYMDAIGDTMKVENWFEGRKFREQLDYFGRMKGLKKPPLYKYSFFNLNGEEVFKVYFNTDNRVEDLSGSPIFCLYNSSHLQPGGTFELSCFLGIPKLLNYTFIVNELNSKNNEIISSRQFKSDSPNQILTTDFGKEFYVEKKYLRAGAYTWKLILTLADTNRNILVHDSTNIEVVVH